MPQNEQEIETILKMLDKSKQIDEFLKLLPQILSTFEKMKEMNNEERNGLGQQWQQDFARLESQVQKIIKGKDGVNGNHGKDGLTPSKEELLELIIPLIPKVKDGKQGVTGKNGISPTKTEIEAIIKPLLPSALAIANAIPRQVQTPAKSYQIHTKDCSSQCDGANKTFSVGGTHFGIIGVFSTQAPLIFRPVIDYTETKTGVLLTSEVGAPQSGQSLIVQFLK